MAGETKQVKGRISAFRKSPETVVNEHGLMPLPVHEAESLVLQQHTCELFLLSDCAATRNPGGNIVSHMMAKAC